MNIDKSNIESLRKLINLINHTVQDKKDLSEIHMEELYKYISKENLSELLKILSTVRKTNINKIEKYIKLKEENVKVNEMKQNEEIKYDLKEIFMIFNNLSDNEIYDKYKLLDLRAMYASIYSENPSKGKSKSDIIDVIRNYIYISKRANAFK